MTGGNQVVGWEEVRVGQEVMGDDVEVMDGDGVEVICDGGGVKDVGTASGQLCCHTADTQKAQPDPCAAPPSAPSRSCGPSGHRLRIGKPILCLPLASIHHKASSERTAPQHLLPSRPDGRGQG